MQTRTRSIAIVTPPAVEPFTWDDLVKTHLRVDDDDELHRVSDINIPAARAWCESFTERQLITATWKMELDCFPLESYIVMSKPPLQSVTHVKYYDTGGVQQTWDSANYIVHTPSGEMAPPGLVALAPDVLWPSVQTRINAVEIQFVAGYGTERADVPAPLREAMLLHIAESFERREDAIAGTTISKVPRDAETRAGPYMIAL